MCKKIGKLIALLLSITSFFLRAGHVFALEVNYPPLLGKTLNDTSKLGDFVCYLFSFGTAVAFSIAGGTIIVGGVYYLVSYGSSKITNKGKEIIKSGIMGFLLVLASYLIIYTINPDLTKCKVGFLPIPPIFTFFSSSSTKPGIPTTTYKEIPIGTLTENLLTKTINCYGFSETGDPINGDKIKTDDGKDVYGPTFIDHDRADCLLKLTDGAQKKSQMIAGLSNEINKLMSQCTCKDPATGISKCNPVCGGEGSGATGCALPSGNQSGSGDECKNTYKEPDEYCKGTCAKGNPLTDGCKPKLSQSGDCCPTGVKDKIEHGTINVSVEVSDNGVDFSNARIQPNNAVASNAQLTRQTVTGNSVFNLASNYIASILDTTWGAITNLFPLSGETSKPNITKSSTKPNTITYTNAGNTITIAPSKLYNQPGNITYTDESGKTTTINSTASQSQPGVSTYTDESGNVITITSHTSTSQPGTITYTDPSGKTTTINPTASQGRIGIITSQSQPGTITYTDPSGKTTTINPTASQSQAGIITYTDNNKNTISIKPADSQNQSGVITYTDDSGNTATFTPHTGSEVITYTDDSGNTATFTPHTENQPGVISYADGSGNTTTIKPGNSQTQPGSFTYTDDSGKTTTFKPGNSQTQPGSFTYTDDSGKTTTIFPNNNPQDQPKIITYTDDSGKTTTITPSTSQNQSGVITYTDDSGNTATFTPHTGSEVITYTDDSGNTATFTPHTENQPGVISYADGSGNTATFTPHTGSEVITYTDDSGNTATFTPHTENQPGVISYDDANGNSATFIASQNQPEVITYTDKSGNIITVTPTASNGQSGLITYTDASGKINIVTPTTYQGESGTITYTDESGNTIVENIEGVQGPQGAQGPQGSDDATGKCKTESVAYKGLDEFRCTSNCSEIPSLVEKQVTVNSKKITVIDQAKWKELTLIQQLTYFKEKIDEREKEIQTDKSQLESSATELGKCYLAIPYIDLLKIRQSTSQTANLIKINKTTISDSESDDETQADSSKYCSGFNYSGSSCLEKCNNMCPDTSQDAMKAYKKCADEKDPKLCIEAAYDSRPCIYSDEKDADGKPIKFINCISSCVNDCPDNCAKLYIKCSYEYNFCKSQCKKDSNCVLNNENKCLYDSNKIIQCADKATDQGNINYCMNNAYLCKNGSDQYAGSSDCVEPAVIKKCASFKNKVSCDGLNGCLWDDDNEFCFQNSSSSFLYDNQKSEKCYNSESSSVNPYNSAQKDSACYSPTSPNASCIDVCPETAKCPAASMCPDCPCGRIEDTSTARTAPQTISFYVPTDDIGQYKTTSEEISAYQIAGPECNGYSYNDDPLTFYCEDKWYNDPNKEQAATPIGSERTCSQSQEIPVGQMVDNAGNWADNLINNADAVKKSAQKIIDQMTKVGTAGVAGKAYNYCKCDAKHDSGNTPVCTTDCKFNPPDADAGNCSCSFVPCEGSPCEQMADYLSELWGDYGELKNNFITFYTTMLAEPRSDIIKELTYSRQQTNTCSSVTNNYGLDERLLNCTRAMDEIVSPISKGSIMFDNQKIDNYCYGKYLGKLFNKTLTDNWYCCQSTVKNPTPRQGQSQ